MTWRRKNRSGRDLHYLNDEGMVVCNPRDREVAHRATVEGIATEDIFAVTCKKCRSVMSKMGVLRRYSNSGMRDGRK